MPVRERATVELAGAPRKEADGPAGRMVAELAEAADARAAAGRDRG